MAKRTKVCTHLTRAGKSCPNLAEPGSSRCTEHPGQPKNAPWSGHREPWERAQRAKLRAAALKRYGHTCQRCAASNVPVELHHVKPISLTTTLADCLLVCSPCHQEIDSSAR